MALNRAQFLAAIAAATVEKTIDGVGIVKIRQVSEAEFTTFSDVAQRGGEAFLERLAVASLVDDDGQPVLTLDDLPALKAGAFGPVQAILSAVAEANRIGGAEKNSQATPVAASSTA